MQNLFSMVLTASFWGTVFTLAVLGLNKVLRKKVPAVWHYYIWIPVILRFLIPVTITLAVAPPTISPKLHIVPAVLQEMPKETAASSPVESEKSTVYTDTAAEEIIAYQPSVQNEAKPASVIVDSYVIGQAAAFVWVTVSFLLILKMMIAYFRYLRKVKQNIMPVPEQWIDIFNKVSNDMGGTCKTALYMGYNEDSPFTIGIFKKYIILPDRNYKDGQIEMILRHELTHIQRRDIIIKFLAEFVRAVHWFNPFAYITARQMEYYCEISCDAAVLKAGSQEERICYAQTIMDTVSCTLSRKPVLSLSVSRRKNKLKLRIGEILESRQKRMNMPLVLLFTAVILGACACSAVQITEKIPDSNTYTPEVIEENSADQELPAEYINILIAGIDDTDVRSDVLTIMNIDFTENKITALAIPRDTYLEPTENLLSRKKEGHTVPQQIKILEVLSYAQGEGQMEFLKHEVENLLDISLDYTVAMNMNGFEKLIDAVGGVEMDIPEDMYYIDPTQNLSISLKAGVQVLDGESALHFVRYRIYPQGDVDRIGKQQEFMKALFKAVMNDENKLGNLFLYLQMFMEEVETDMSLAEATAFLPFVFDFSENDFETGLLPGHTEMIDLRSFYILDREKFETDYAEIFR